MLSKIKTINDLYLKSIIKNQIDYLKICNFRQFEQNSSVNFDYPLTILVGKNGSGKSTFLKLIKSIAKGKNPNDYFFETEWDKFSDQEVLQFQYKLNGIEYKEVKTNHFDWVFSKLEQSLETNREIKDYLSKQERKDYEKIIEVEFKSLIGSFEKNTFFDNQTSNSDLKVKVNYAKRVTKKVQQSIETKNNKGKKVRVSYVSANDIKIINKILDKQYSEISIINHRFFSGTWGTSIIFKSGEIYSEANSGSGEFIVANIVNKLSSIPSESLLLLDEPELSLHPGAQKRLLEFFLDLIIKKRIQIILSTHSQSFIELIPNQCLKNFIVNSKGKTLIEQGVNYLNAFDNLEISFNAPIIVVEDSLAKKIIERVIKSENLEGQFNVKYFSGGASSIKTSLITTFSKVDDFDKFIIFDGDMYITKTVDLSFVSESEKTKEYLEQQIKLVTGINIANFHFHVDGGKQGSNEEQKKHLYIKYLNYYKDQVLFLPKKMPEDIIYDRDYILSAFSFVNISGLDTLINSKEKFKFLSEETDISIESLYDVFIGYFISKRAQNSEYHEILKLLKYILFLSKSVK